MPDVARRSKVYRRLKPEKRARSKINGGSFPIDDPTKREELLQAMAHGSAAAWGHLNLLGEYDFSEDKLQDSVGIKPPKLTD